MKPTLFSLPIAGGIGFHSYGVAIAIGFFLGVILALRQGRRWGIERDGILDAAFWMLVGGLGGARLLYVVLNAGDYVRLCRGTGAPRGFGRAVGDCTVALRVWEGGLVFYGGGIAGLLVMAWMARRRGWHFGKLADVFIPSLALGHVFGRLGCFASGCCFGKECAPGAAWAAVCAAFPPGSVAYEDLQRHGLLAAGAMATPLLHPTQLYEAGGEALIFVALVFFRGRQPFFGATSLLYGALYAVMRGTVEIFRGDAARRFVVEFNTPTLAAMLGLPVREPLFLSTSQAISVAVALAAATWFALLRRQQLRG